MFERKVELIHLLLEHKADVNVSRCGMLPIDGVISAEILRLFLRCEVLDLRHSLLLHRITYGNFVGCTRDPTTLRAEYSSAPALVREILARPDAAAMLARRSRNGRTPVEEADMAIKQLKANGSVGNDYLAYMQTIRDMFSAAAE